MSDRQQLAEHATGLGVVGLATMGLNAAPLIPLAVLAAWGIDRYKSCSQRKQRDTINRVVKQIEKANPDHRAVGPALALLKENRHKVAVSPTTLADAEKRGNFPDTLYDIVFAGVEVPKDDGIEALLRMVLTAAWQELRLEDDYHKVFVQESVTALERDLADPPDPAADLVAARHAVDAALAIYTPEHTPYHHETATRLRDDILAAQDALG